MKLKCFLFIIFFITNLTNVKSQTNHADSLNKLSLLVESLKQIKTDSAKLNTLFQIHYFQLALIGDLSEDNVNKLNFNFTKQAIFLATELKKYDTLKSLTIDLGYIFDLNKNYDSSFVYYYNCLNTFENASKYELSSSLAQNILYNISNLQKIIEDDNKKALLQKSRINNLTFIIMAVLIVLLSFIAWFFIKTTKVNKLLTVQKDEILKSNVKIDSSINYAQTIQQSILSDENKLNSIFKESFVLYKPKDKVSGDFLWTYKKDNIAYIAVADCTGHGVPGALLSIVGTFLFELIVSQNKYISPANILSELHLKIIKSLNQNDANAKHKNDGMDVGVIEFNTATNKIVFAGAHRNLLHIRNNKLTEIKGVKRPIGGSNIKYTNQFIEEEINIENGDLIYSFTDGFQDQFGGNEGKKFKSSVLINVIKQNSYKTIKLQKQELETIFCNYKGDLEQTDDVLVIGIKF